MIKLVLSGIYILILISGILFIGLLIKIVYGQFIAKKDEEVLIEVKEEINNYLAGEDLNLAGQISEQKIRIMGQTILTYLKNIRGETAERLKKLAEESGIVEFKIKQLINSGQWWKKSEAAYVLGNLGAKEAVAPLLECLEEENIDLRYQSALALVKIAETKYLSLAINKLIELDFYPQDTILRLVEEVEDDIYQIMEEFIAADKVEKKIIAIRSLGLKKDYRSLDWIKKYIKAVDIDLVTASLQTAYHLGDVGNEDYFKLLMTTKSHPSSQVRANLARVLEKFRRVESREQLKKLMTDSQWEVRYNAAQGLLAHGIKGLIALSQQLHSSDGFAQDMAWQTLQEEIVFNSLLEKGIVYNYPQLVENIKDYLVTTNKEGVNHAVERYFD